MSLAREVCRTSDERLLMKYEVGGRLHPWSEERFEGGSGLGRVCSEWQNMA